MARGRPPVLPRGPRISVIQQEARIRALVQRIDNPLPPLQPQVFDTGLARVVLVACQLGR